MPGRTKTKAKKIIVKKTKISVIPVKHHRKDMRFKVSLVILMGMLTFSAMLLLLSLNTSLAVKAETGTIKAVSAINSVGIKKSSSQTLSDSALDFKITVPAELGSWLYKIGEVKSLTDDSLSDQYLRIFIPLAGAKSNNFDQQNKDILTIRRFSADEWSAIEKSCQKEKKDVCDAAGELIVQNDEWAYAYTKPTDCPKSIVAKCALAEKIIKSFNQK
jgi:hypothetical protein